MSKKYCSLVVIMLLVIVVSGCSQNAVQPATKLGVALSNEVFSTISNIQDKLNIDDEHSNSINILGYQLTKKIYENNKENAIFSPFSLSSALAMLANGATGETKEEIIAAIGADANAFNSTYNQIINQLNSYSGEKDLGGEEKVETTKISTANSAWFNQDLVIKQKYIDELKKYYDADAMNVDFADPLTKSIMNKWIEKKTNDLLKNTVKETSSDHAAFLINTLYFKGTWQDQFKIKDTEQKSFYLADGREVTVDMMHGNFDKEYYEDDDCQIVALNYYDATMYVLLPKQGLESFINTEKYSNIDKMIKEMANTNVAVSFPKFKHQNSTELNEYLKGIGVTKVFDPGLAELGKISDTKMFLSRAFQNTTIEVDEDGTEAAAVTVLEIKRTSMPDSDKATVFNCNKPFMYLIKDNKTGINLFMGMVNNPIK